MSTGTNAILFALVDQGVESSYIRTLANCYRHCSTTVQLLLSNLRFADDIVSKVQLKQDDVPKAGRSWKED
ncbi:unnamed protein product [Nippostrongylus brasiliensis]|uniref:Pentatricopeptide repeat-containing protein n=1 Tax=Nippostrongylus brasiliensis TaxID=27835 RepID=A0A0N4YK00_NIPBR|nr:unnamed protein product [Nippostrongylus brasiliensis]